MHLETMQGLAGKPGVLATVIPYSADVERMGVFRQPLGGGPVWLEVNDEGFGAEDAVERVVAGPKGLEIGLKPGQAAAFGYAASVAVRIGPGCEDAAEALAALRAMLGGVMVEAAAG